MLGSHDSFTYMVARNGIVDTFTSFWRCQEKTIKEQYDLGVMENSLGKFHMV